MNTKICPEQWTSAFPDWRFDLLALIAEGDRVVAHMPYRGTHRQAILGIAPTSRSCAVDEIVIFRIADGKIAEAWEVYGEAGRRPYRRRLACCGDGGDTRGGRAGMVGITVIPIVIPVRSAPRSRSGSPAVAVFSPQAEGRV